MKNEVPYIEKKLDKSTYKRTFKHNLNTDELEWHKDAEDRIVEVIENKGNWFIQIDNKLPEKLEGKIFIPKETYHRAIKGTDDLIITITKLK